MGISDHKPLQFAVPREKPEQSRKTRRLRLEEITEAQWSGRDTALTQRLDEATPMIGKHFAANSVSRMYVTFGRILWDLLEPM